MLLLNLKTFPLFYLSFQLPLLYKTDKLSKYYTIDRVIYISFIFSLLFQIADDFEDYISDQKSDSTNSFIKLLGKKETYELYKLSICNFNKEIKDLNISVLSTIVYLLNKKINKYINQEWIQ